MGFGSIRSILTNGHEYYGQFKTWCTKRGIILTRTAGDDPQGNGRAEVAVYAINRQVRATLLQTGADEVLRCARVGKEVMNFQLSFRRSQ